MGGLLVRLQRGDCRLTDKTTNDRSEGILSEAPSSVSLLNTAGRSGGSLPFSGFSSPPDSDLPVFLAGDELTKGTRL